MKVRRIVVLAVGLVLIAGCQLLSGVGDLAIATRANGKPCGLAAECASGFCVDGVCCDGPCQGACVSCAADGLMGTCTPHQTGTDPEDGCGSGWCDGAGVCVGGTHEWSHQYGDEQSQAAAGVAVDSEGNVIVVGGFRGTLEFGDEPLVANGSSDIFVAKLGSDGSTHWSKRFGDGYYEQALRVAVDSHDRIVVTGHFQGLLDVGAGLNVLDAAGTTAVFVVQLDSAGAPLWAQAFPGFVAGAGTTSEQFTHVAIDSADDVVLAGHLTGSVSFGGDVLDKQGGEDIYLAKLMGDTGGHSWSLQIPSSGSATQGTSSVVADLVLDEADGPIITGNFGNTLHFADGDREATSNYRADMYLARFAADGAAGWSQSFTGPWHQHAGALAVDLAGRIVLSGSFHSRVTFGETELAAPVADKVCVFFAKFQPDGTHYLSRAFQSMPFQNDGYVYLTIPTALSVDSSDNLTLSGALWGSVEFSGSPLNSAGSVDVFFAKFTSTGEHLLSKRYGDDKVQWPTAGVVDADDSLIMAGLFNGEVNFGGQGLQAAGGADMSVYDVFVVKYAR